jgi:hypothetical protein
VEAERAATLQRARARTKAYEAADEAGSDGMVDWGKTDQAPALLRHVDSDVHLRRLSMRRATKGPRASLRPTMPKNGSSLTSVDELDADLRSSSAAVRAAAAVKKSQKEKAEKEKARELTQKKKPMRKRMSSIRLPAFALYGGGAQDDDGKFVSLVDGRNSPP